MTTSENRLRPAPSWAYRLMIWTLSLMDFVRAGRPEAHLAKAPLRAGMTVVDWGCGPGRYVIPAARIVGSEGKVYAVDIQPEAIEIVSDRAARASLTNVETMLIDSYTAPIASASVDLVLNLDAFHGISDRPALLREIHRLLKPDGRLFMDPGHMPMGRAREIVDGTGLFSVVEQSGNDLLLVPRPRM
jgi:ubiquinone/menaquinone biosynthesis C-methylase UbiE